MEHAPETLWIEAQLNFWEAPGQFKRGRFERHLRAKLLDQFLDKGFVIHGRQHKSALRSLSKLEDLANHVADAIDLLANAGLCLLAHLGGGPFHAGHLG